MFKRFTTIICMLCLMCSSFARVSDFSEGYIFIIANHEGGTEKGNAASIHASIDGHYLTIAFTEDLGQVAVEITTATGGYVQTSSCLTPNGLQFYIPLAGFFRKNAYICC